MRNSTSRYIALLDFPQTCEGRGTGMHRQFVTSSFIPPFFKLSFWVGLSDFPPSPLLPPFSGTASVNGRFKWKEVFFSTMPGRKGNHKKYSPFLFVRLQVSFGFELQYCFAHLCGLRWTALQLQPSQHIWCVHELQPVQWPQQFALRNEVKVRFT